MKTEQISDALNYLDDDLIYETEKLRQKNITIISKIHQKNVFSARHLFFAVTMAACICLLIISGITTKDEPSLPILSLSGSFGNLGAGIDEVVYQNLSEHIKLSPWNTEQDKQPLSLPVYENIYYTENSVPYGFDRTEMEAALENMILGLKTRLISSSYTEATKYQGASLSAVTENAVISIDSRGTVTIAFDSYGLPDQYRVTEDSSTDQTLAGISYLLNQFKQLLCFTEPIIDVVKEYDYTGNFRYRYKVYEGSGEVKAKLLNRQYNSTEFTYNETGDISTIKIENKLSCATWVGDYPIISDNQARELLCEGHYFTQGRSDFSVDETLIEGWEMVYPSSNQPEIMIPYYCFYVKNVNEIITDQDGRQLTLYQKCYVPAVAERYIENMPDR